MEEERLYDVYAIEEDIKILKEFINYKDKSNSHFQLVAISHERLCESIEHLIEAYKEQEKTIKCTQNSWFEDTQKIEKYKTDYIPKSKIKEKIEELEFAIHKNQNIYTIYKINEINFARICLAELLEEE